MSERNQNAASRLERTLTLEILRGSHPPGVRLAPVRELASRFEVNPATVQRAIARLEATGLVAARHGSGVRVNDPVTSGDVSLVPAWLEALAERPDEASAVLDEFLEVRRILASRLLVRHRDKILNSPALASAAGAYATAAEIGGDELRDADLAFARLLLAEVGNRVAMAVFNTAARVVEEVPAVAQAMYADPASNAASVAEVLSALGTLEGTDLGARVEAVLESVDAGTVRRYRELLEASS